jgi:hypothetical protein
VLIEIAINFIQLKSLSWLKPAVPKRTLLFVAAVVWTFAGSMLMYRGYKMVDTSGPYVWLILLLSLTGGIIFYLKLFSGISLKHTLRILSLKEAYPCFFSFFNFRSYLMMVLMITMGITLRTTGWIPPVYLSLLYLMMSVPLLISSVRFYYTGFYYRQFIVAVDYSKRERS